MGAALAVAAAVVALVVGITVMVSRDGVPVASPPTVTAISSPEVISDTDRPSDPTSPVASLTAPPSGEEGVGMQTVVFKQLQVEVPAAWKLNAVECNSAVADTVIVIQNLLACGSVRTDGVTVVQFRDDVANADMLRGPGGIPSSIPGDRVLDSVRFDGRINEAEGLEVTTVAVPELGVSVQISSAERATVDRILATLRQASTPSPTT